MPASQRATTGLIRSAGLWIALVILLPLAAWPCRYSVRDTGFVDLDQPPWRLRLEGFEPPAAEAWQKAASGHLLDANLRLENIPAKPTPIDPSLVLVGPDDRRLPVTPSVGWPAQPADIAEFLDRLALSPTRDRLHESLLRSFAVFVLIEGTNAERNASANQAALDAIRVFTPRLKSLPKPVDTPPVLVSIPTASLSSERILVWSLGCDPQPSPDPRLVVLFGRGRRLGEPIEGALITRTLLEERLTLIGQDCECDLDRAWLQGPVFPARWDAARQAEAARRLGFDPESPLVRTEVSRIVLRGPIAGEPRRTAPAPSPTQALGYREDRVDAADDEAPDPTNSTTIAPAPSPAEPGRLSSGQDSPGSTRLPWIAFATFLLATLGIGGYLLARTRPNS